MPMSPTGIQIHFKPKMNNMPALHTFDD